ncbi:Pesticidal crystal cry8ba protein [Thalictrum thalictroides]|uniref:Pesticidal crystal cry8ba protein n=1 Tax=Thalictrum thalictroides TaxID=46969 RepID=A0A7J6WYK0_THATH|nr:Pesticidal crystal cry8ba protein [Thalictrum thalictroides]
MRAQHFYARNLRLHGPWKWLLSEFADYYGVSDSYTKLRYLSFVMNVATPTMDCLETVYELLVPVVKARSERSLTRQEKSILLECETQVENLVASVFENYKSLDELSPTGLTDLFGPISESAAPALVPAVQVYTLLHDILAPEAQTILRNYLQPYWSKLHQWLEERNELSDLTKRTVIARVELWSNGSPSATQPGMKGVIMQITNDPQNPDETNRVVRVAPIRNSESFLAATTTRRDPTVGQQRIRATGPTALQKGINRKIESSTAIIKRLTRENVELRNLKRTRTVDNHQLFFELVRSPPPSKRSHPKARACRQKEHGLLRRYHPPRRYHQRQSHSSVQQNRRSQSPARGLAPGRRQEAEDEDFNNKRLQEMVDLAVANQVNREERIRRLMISGLTISLLADKAKNHVIPNNIKQPPFEQYNEINGCLVQHVMNFLIMAIQDHDDRLLTKMFSASLKGETHAWYHRLQPGSIRSFVKLAEMFVEKYRFNEKPKKGANALFTLQLKLSESIQNFVQSNQKELYRSFTKKPSMTVSALLEKAERYAHEEDELKAWKKRLPGDQLSDKPEKEKDYDSVWDWKRRNLSRDLERRADKITGGDRKEREFTPLRFPLDEVYRKIKGRALLNKLAPLPADTDGRRDRLMKCEHHNNYGLKLKNCRALKYEMQRLANVGHIPYMIRTKEVELVKAGDHVVCHAESTIYPSQKGKGCTATRKRCRRYMAETDEFISSNSDGSLTDPIAISTAYLKMKNLCLNISNEIQADIKIHNQHVLPSSIDLSNIAAAVYSTELCKRLGLFLATWPPSSPLPHVTDLLIATADFERDLELWNIRPVKEGVISRNLFHNYIMVWVEDKQLYLLDLCKAEKVPWSGETTNHSIFAEDMYEKIKVTLNEYEVVINRWPQYSLILENAVTTIERAVIKALERQYSDILTPLKDSIPKKLGMHVQKLTRRQSVALYSIPSQLGIFLNTIKRILDILHCRIEDILKPWASCLPVIEDKKSTFGEQLNAVTVLLRTKYKNYMQATVEKLVSNMQGSRSTRLKRILEETKEADGEAEIRERMQILCSQLMDSISNIHEVFSSHIFVAICRGFWDRMGQIVLKFLENRKENRVWYNGSYYALGILDDTFASQMQRLQGNALQNKDLEPPRSVVEARSILCRDTKNTADPSTYFYT